MARVGYLAKVNIVGDSVVFTDEATTTSDNQNYIIANSAKNLWSLDSVLVVKEDATITSENYTLNRLTGSVMFNTIDAGRGVITVSGDYLPRIEVTEAHEYSLTINGETLDITKFGSSFIQKQAGLKSAEASLTEFWNTNQYLLKDLIQGNIVVLEIFPDSTTPTEFTRMFAIITSDELSVAVSDISDMSISFESTNKMVIG